MTTDNIIVSFERCLAAMRGSRIVRVRYAAIDYGDGMAHWDFGRLHNPELGVELTLSSGASVEIGWGWDFNHYGLAVSSGAEPHLWSPTALMWDVTDLAEWVRVSSGVIEQVLVYWHSPTDEDAPWHEYPQDLEIVVDGGYRA